MTEKTIDKINLFKFVGEHIGDDTIPKSDQGWCVGPAEWFTERSLMLFSDQIIYNGLVHVTKDYEDDIWLLGGLGIVSDLLDVLNAEKKRTMEDYKYRPLIIRYKLFNGYKGYTNEFGIEKKDDDIFPIYGEFGFPFNDPANLITNCVMFLNEYKPVVYSIGAVIGTDFENFAMDFFVLERGSNSKPDGERTKELSIRNYFAIYYKPKEFRNWGPDVDENDIKQCFFNGDLSKYNVNIVVYKRITKENLHEDVEYEIDLSIIDDQKTGKVKIKTDSEYFHIIYCQWTWFAACFNSKE